MKKLLFGGRHRAPARRLRDAIQRRAATLSPASHVRTAISRSISPSSRVARKSSSAILKQQGVEAWNKWRRQAPDTHVDLREANLSGPNLTGADLSGARFFDTILSKVDLSRCRTARGLTSFGELLGGDAGNIRQGGPYTELARVPESDPDLNRGLSSDYALRRRRRTNPSPTRPVPTRASVAGSGTGGGGIANENSICLTSLKLSPTPGVIISTDFSVSPSVETIPNRPKSSSGFGTVKSGTIVPEFPLLSVHTTLTAPAPNPVRSS